MPSTFKVTLVQPKAYRFNEERKNLNRAVEYIRSAAKMGTEIISFPECYPGPYSGPCDFSPVKALCKEAKSRWGNLNAAFMTHPPTFKRILLLRQIEQEMKTSGYGPSSIYRCI